eukprot:3169307-Amphidinium_carterae.1
MYSESEVGKHAVVSSNKKLTHDLIETYGYGQSCALYHGRQHTTPNVGSSLHSTADPNVLPRRPHAANPKSLQFSKSTLETSHSK